MGNRLQPPKPPGGDPNNNPKNQVSPTHHNVFQPIFFIYPNPFTLKALYSLSFLYPPFLKPPHREKKTNQVFLFATTKVHPHPLLFYSSDCYFDPNNPLALLRFFLYLSTQIPPPHNPTPRLLVFFFFFFPKGGGWGLFLAPPHHTPPPRPWEKNPPPVFPPKTTPPPHPPRPTPIFLFPHFSFKKTLIIGARRPRGPIHPRWGHPTHPFIFFFSFHNPPPKQVWGGGDSLNPHQPKKPKKQVWAGVGAGFFHTPTTWWGFLILGHNHKTPKTTKPHNKTPHKQPTTWDWKTKKTTHTPPPPTPTPQSYFPNTKGGGGGHQTQQGGTTNTGSFFFWVVLSHTTNTKTHGVTTKTKNNKHNQTTPRCYPVFYPPQPTRFSWGLTPHTNPPPKHLKPFLWFVFYPPPPNIWSGWKFFFFFLWGL